MRPRLNRATLIAAIVLGITFPAWSQTPAVGGKWRMTIEFADEARSAGLEINVDGRKVGGRLIASFAGGDVPIEGEISNGTLTFSGSTTSGPHPGMQLDFSATLKGDILTGSMSAPFGDFHWTAVRLDAAYGQ